jgi:hypothetical protein
MAKVRLVGAPDHLKPTTRCVGLIHLRFCGRPTKKSRRSVNPQSRVCRYAPRAGSAKEPSLLGSCPTLFPLVIYRRSGGKNTDRGPRADERVSCPSSGRTIIATSQSVSFTTARLVDEARTGRLFGTVKSLAAAPSARARPDKHPQGLKVVAGTTRCPSYLPTTLTSALARRRF